MTSTNKQEKLATPAIILLNGFKGTGKTTLARALANMLAKREKYYITLESFAAPLRTALNNAHPESEDYLLPPLKEVTINGLTVNKLSTVGLQLAVNDWARSQELQDYLYSTYGDRNLNYREALHVISQYIGADSVRVDRTPDSKLFRFTGTPYACDSVVAQLLIHQNSKHQYNATHQYGDEHPPLSIHIFDDYRYPYEAEELRKYFGNENVIEVYMERDEISNQYIGAEVGLSERMAQDNCRNFAVLENGMKPPECLYLNMTGLAPEDGAKALASTITLMELAE